MSTYAETELTLCLFSLFLLFQLYTITHRVFSLGEHILELFVFFKHKKIMIIPCILCFIFFLSKTQIITLQNLNRNSLFWTE